MFFQFLDIGALIVISIHQKGCQCLESPFRQYVLMCHGHKKSAGCQGYTSFTKCKNQFTVQKHLSLPLEKWGNDDPLAVHLIHPFQTAVILQW